MSVVKHKPRTKAAKRRKSRKVMREFTEGALFSSSGDKVTEKDQAVAIALSEAGLSRKRKRSK
jgi:hypothetical protein